MDEKKSATPQNGPRFVGPRDRASAPAPRDTASAELTAALRDLRADVLSLVGKLASGTALATHRDELRQAVHEDVGAETKRLRAHLDELIGLHGEALRQRTASIDGLLSGLERRLREDAARIDAIDARVSVRHVNDLVEQAANETAERVYVARFQAGLDELTKAFLDADDRFGQLRAYIDTFGPGGLPVVAQERDAWKRRAEELGAALEASQQEVLAQRARVLERETEALHRRVVEGVDPAALDRLRQELDRRERDLDVREGLQAENARLTVQLERLQVALAKWEEIGRAEQSARADAAQLARFKEEAAESERARQEAVRKLRDVERRMQSAEENAERWAAEVRRLETVAATAEDRERRLEAVQAENRALVKQYEAGQRTVSELSREVRDRDTHVSELAAEILAAKQEAAVAMEAGRRAEAERVRAEHEARRAELEKWAAAQADRMAAEHRADAARLAEEVGRLKERLAARDAEVARLGSELQRTRTELEAANVRLAGLEAAYTKRVELLDREVREHEQRALARATEEAERLRAELSAVGERERDAAREEAARLTQMADDALAMREENVREAEELAARKGTLAAEVEALQAELVELRVKVVPADERAAQLRMPVFADLADVSTPTEAEWLGSVERGIRDAGFLFHPRLLRAYHTSLKIAHHAPLVVLAGISGTGKSELPRLYADLGGVPFLPLAVQPSWDSPTDLFGFFNYTDGRLKAEPLARLLWQVGNDEALRRSPSVVLLDEMNLARVEYYFAELLSKLEARRAVRRSADPGLRRRASVLVDTGPNGAEEALYLDERVLFVGTMNQDESTLTLSDKVLDRACVLTFPAPRTMHMTEQRPAPPRPQRLAWETWASWIAEPEGGTEQERELNEINAAMADLRRPFGHRLFRAIHAFVANYPGDPKHAFADQFAMKIMPRLQGLECDNGAVKRGLDRLAEHVPDELVEAFGAARDHEFFTWAGAPEMYAVEEGA